MFERQMSLHPFIAQFPTISDAVITGVTKVYVIHNSIFGIIVHFVFIEYIEKLFQTLYASSNLILMSESLHSNISSFVKCVVAGFSFSSQM